MRVVGVAHRKIAYYEPIDAMINVCNAIVISTCRAAVTVVNHLTVCPDMTIMV